MDRTNRTDHDGPSDHDVQEAVRQLQAELTANAPAIAAILDEALPDNDPLAGLTKRELYLLGNACERYEGALRALRNIEVADEVRGIRERILKLEGLR